MISLEEFQTIAELYFEEFGHTYTTFGRFPGNPDFEIAYNLMLQCLNGERTEPVTDEAIGVAGEGVRE